jgi:hypothetical protein
MTERLLRAILRCYLWHLERRIQFDNWDGDLSRKIDVIRILLKN